MECDEGDVDDDLEEIDLGTYCLVVDPGQATHYGGVVECEMTETQLRFKLTAEAAGDLAMPTDVTFALELPAEQLSMLKQGLTRVLTSGHPDAQPTLLTT